MRIYRSFRDAFIAVPEDVSRIVRGKLELRPEPVDVHGCVPAALEVCRSALTAKGLQVAIQWQATKATVNGEEARLQQVFWNLLQNAAKFTPEGGAITVCGGPQTEAPAEPAPAPGAERPG
jgi:signal transduction histidine kinase